MKKEIVSDIKFLGILFLVIIGICLYASYTNKNQKTDAEKFKEEYQNVEEDNLFVYKTEEEIIKILEGGTGVVFLGFPECKWCQTYAPLLNEAVKEAGLEEIYYYNIKEIRKENTENYQKIVSILKEHLLKDNEGNERVYVPDVSIVKQGKILGHDNETSVIEEGITPEEYWTNDKKQLLKDKLIQMIDDAALIKCTGCDE